MSYAAYPDSTYGHWPTVHEIAAEGSLAGAVTTSATATGGHLLVIVAATDTVTAGATATGGH